MYSPERVSTRTRSPWLMNNGTWITLPVCSVAGLRAPLTRSPWTPGSVSLIVSSTAWSVVGALARVSSITLLATPAQETAVIAVAWPATLAVKSLMATVAHAMLGYAIEVFDGQRAYPDRTPGAPIELRFSAIPIGTDRKSVV